MKCPKCGKELNDADKFCTACGEKLKEEVQVEKVEQPQEMQTPQVEEKRYVQSMDNATFLCMISLICYFGGPIISGILTAIANQFSAAKPLTGITGLLPLAGLIICIIARVKYPESKFAKVLLIVYIVLIALGIIAIIVIIVACASALRGCSEMGLIINMLSNLLW